MAAIKGCFIKIDNTYFEISFDTHMTLRQVDPSYRERRFIVAGGGYFLEVSPEVHEQMGKERERSKYLRKLESNANVLSLAYLYDDDTELESLIADPDQDVELEAVRQLQIEELQNALSILTTAELALYKALYCDGIEGKDYADMLGVREQTVSRRRTRMLKKLRKHYGL